MLGDLHLKDLKTAKLACLSNFIYLIELQGDWHLRKGKIRECVSVNLCTSITCVRLTVV